MKQTHSQIKAKRACAVKRIAAGLVAMTFVFGSSAAALRVQAQAQTAERTAVRHEINDTVLRGVVPYGFYAGDGGIMWSNGDGTFKKNEWLHFMGKSYYFNSAGYVVTGFQNIGGKLYYLPADGIIRTGWNSAPEGSYYVLSDGSVAVNTVIGGQMIGANGIAAGSAAAAQQAAAQQAAALQAQAAAQQVQAAAPVSEFHGVCLRILDQITTPGMTNEQKLAAAYSYVINATTYKRTYDTPAGDWTKSYAMDIYSTGQGNCYRYAAAFAYLARAIGYDVRVCTGQISARRGGTTPHGWVEVYYGGQWLICDPDMQDADGRDYFLKTFAAYPVKPLNKTATWAISF